MILKILLLLLSLLIIANFVLAIVSAIYKVNLFKKYSRILILLYIIFFLFVTTMLLTFALLGWL